MAPVLGLFGYTAGADPTVGYGGTFARPDSSTCATYLDSTLSYQTVAANIPRYLHYDPVQGGPLLLREMAATNLCLQSEALATTWSNGTTNTNAYAMAAGLSFTRLTAVVGNDNYQAITFTGNGTKAFFIHVKQDAAVSGAFICGIRDLTDASGTVQITVTVAANGVVTAVKSAGSGTVSGVDALADGVYRVRCTATAITAAHTHRIYSSWGGLGETCASVLQSGVQVENAIFSSSYIATTTGTVTRAADVLSFAFGARPQAMTIYADLTPKGFAAGSNDRLVSIGYGGAATSFMSIYNNGSGHRSQSISTAGTVTTADTLTPPSPPSQRNEVRLAVAADGSIVLGQSLNGAAETVTASTAANTLDATFSVQTIFIGSLGSAASFGSFALASIKVAAGVQTLATMRSLAVPSIVTTTNALSVSSLDAIVAAYGQPQFSVIDTGTGAALTATATPRADQQVRLLKLNVTFSASPSSIPIVVYDGDTTILWRGYTSATGPFFYHFNFTRKPLRSSRGNALSVCVPSGGAAVVGTVSWDGDFVRAP